MGGAIPLATVADAWLGDLARRSGSAALAAIDGATLLGERAMLKGLRIPGRVSAGGGCRLYDAQDGVVALNLSRPDDRDLLPALFEIDGVVDDRGTAAQIARRGVRVLVERGRLLGMAIAADDEQPPPPLTMLARGRRTGPAGRPPRVLDLSALWAGPLAGHLLRLAGAVVTKVDSASRRDTMRGGDPALFRLLDGGKHHEALDLATAAGRAGLLALIASADIVIEAARPRALRQLGVDADALVRARPGLCWITITGHGATGEAAHRVGFGDDCGVAGGLTAALRGATGSTGFVGDAIADPLSGIMAARAAWRAWQAGGGLRIGVAMSGTVAAAIRIARARDAGAFAGELRAWSAAVGAPFPAVARRTAPAAPPARRSPSLACA